MIFSGCDDNSKIAAQTGFYKKHKKEIKGRIYRGKSLIRVDNLIKAGKYREAREHIDSCLIIWFNEVESYQTSLPEINQYSDSDYVNLYNKLELIHQRVWHRERP